jgi:hypothetical protein
MYYMRKRRIEDLKYAAESRGGRCLSTVYESSMDKYEWECSDGHRWHATSDNVIRRKSWCPKCPAKRPVLTDAECVKLAFERGGQFLSATMYSSGSKHLWRCKHNHEFIMRPVHVRGGSWCQKCNPKGTRRTVEDMKKMAAFRGGSFLSLTFKTTNEKYSWECALGHKFSAAAKNIQQGHWCRQCRSPKKPYRPDAVQLSYTAQ